MSIERTPDEQAQALADEARIEQALADAHDDLVSVFLANELDLDSATCDQLIDRMYDRLKEALTPQLLAQAILTELGNRALRQANELLSNLRGLPERRRP